MLKKTLGIQQPTSLAELTIKIGELRTHKMENALALKLKINEYEKRIAAWKMNIQYNKAHGLGLNSEQKEIQRQLDLERDSIFEMVRASRHLEEATTHYLNTLNLLHTLITKKDLCFERIVIGGGVAATLVCSEMSEQFRQTNKKDKDLPGILVLNDPSNPNTWPKEDDRFMGQPAGIQTPQNLTIHSNEFEQEPYHQARMNPYQYVVAHDFARSLIETQNHSQLPMLDLPALEIQTPEDLTSEELSNWEQPDFENRIAVHLNGKIKYLYTHAIDLCAGLGDPNRLKEDQISTALSAELLAKNKLIYAQDGNAPLKGEVVFLGSSAINAAWIAEIQAVGSQPEATIKHWVAQDGNTCNNPRKLNRLIAAIYESNQARIALGTLKEVRHLANGKLELSFNAPDNPSAEYPHLTGKTVICDQLVVSLGQQPLKLTQKLSGFLPCMYENNGDQIDKIPLGTCSKNGRIVTWGAMGSLGIGLSTTESNDAPSAKQFFALCMEHAKTLPQETRAPGGIFRSSFTIKALAKQLRAKGLFPAADPFAAEDLFPDINKATLGDLMSFIAKADPHCSKSQCELFAKAIIDLRMQNKSSVDLGLPGIHRISQLKGIMPSPLLAKFALEYFPFEKQVEAPTAKERGKAYKVRIFSVNRIASNDSYIHTSQVQNENHQKDNTPATTAPIPLRIVGKGKSS